MGTRRVRRRPLESPEMGLRFKPVTPSVSPRIYCSRDLAGLEPLHCLHQFDARSPRKLIALKLAAVEALQVGRDGQTLVPYEHHAPVVEDEGGTNLNQHVLVEGVVAVLVLPALIDGVAGWACQGR
jgi:hypothetical protein